MIPSKPGIYYGRFKKGPKPPGQTWETGTKTIHEIEVVWFGGQIDPKLECLAGILKSGGIYPIDDFIFKERKKSVEEEAYENVLRIRGSNDAPAFDLCVEAEIERLKDVRRNSNRLRPG